MNEHPSLLLLLRKIVLDVTEKPLTDISPTASLAELGIDSISIAEIIVQVEDVLGIEIPANQWLQARTLQEILDMIEQARST